MRILLVEDEPEKKRLITRALVEVDGISEDCIEVATDVAAAKRLLRDNTYDLLILDINLPISGRARAEAAAGLDVLRFIKSNRRARRPKYVVGTTAYDNSFDVASPQFSLPHFKLFRFDYTDTAWSDALQETLRFLIAGDGFPRANDGKSFHVDLGIFVALEDEELTSVLALDGQWKQIPVEFDHTRYYQGQFKENGKSVSVVLAAAPKMGMPPAAVTCTKLINTFRPKLLAISGICAGIRRKTKIGDILIADPCFDWGSGKWIAIKKNDGSPSELRFRPAPYQWRLDESIRSRCKAVGDNQAFLAALHKEYPGKKPVNPPRVLIDAMASGASVLQANKLMEDVSDQHKNVIGVEMESYAVFTASEYASEPRPLCISVKSVCDFGDEKKSDKDHKYAAYTSASFIRHLALDFLGQD